MSPLDNISWERLLTMQNRLEPAAARALRHDGVDAVILFGSRARADPRTDTDWDVCLAGSNEPADVEGTMHLADYRNEANRVDVLWRSRKDLREHTTEGTVWAAIMRDGQAVAGDEEIRSDIEIKPMTRKDVIRGLSIAGRKIETAINHAREETAADESHKPLVNIDGTQASTAAAEHLARGILGLLGAQPGSGHNVAGDADVLEAAAHGALTGDQAYTLRGVANAIHRMNGGTHDAGGATYGGTAQRRDQWEHRIAEVARAYAEVLDGLMNAAGPLAGLAQLPGHGRIKDIMSEVSTTAVHIGDAIREQGTEHLAPDTKHAVNQWMAHWDALAGRQAPQPIQTSGIAMRENARRETGKGTRETPAPGEDQGR